MSLTDKAAWHLESLIGEPVTLARLAKLCAVSPYHLSRAFRSTVGLAPMAYLRARRLSVAAKSLAAGETDILTAALDAQYASHEAFTRAFAAYFGVLPNTVCKARSTTTLSLMEPLQMKKEFLVDVARPDLRERNSFHVVGLGIQCSFENTSAIPSLWQKLNERENEISCVDGAAGYGVCCDANEEGYFRYVAGVEALGNAAVPAEMEKVKIPDGRYAVFTHSGHISDLPKTVYTIWNKSLSDAGLEPRKAPDFELYDRRFDPATGRGDVEIWIPVAQ